MNRETQVRRLAKLWCAWNDQIIDPVTALVKIKELFEKEMKDAWIRYNNKTDEARRRWLREVVKLDRDR